MNINDKKIKDAAIARLTQEKADFESFSGTKAFSKLLGIYVKPTKPTKPTKKKENKVEVEVISNENTEEALSDDCVFNSHIVQYALCFAEGVYKDVYNTLCNFIKQNTYFAVSVLKSKKSFTNCLAYAIHDIVKEKPSNLKFAGCSDYHVYSRAVEFYFDGSKIKFNMLIVNPEGYTPVEFTDADLVPKNSDYLEALELAKQEIIADKKAKAERKAKAEKEKAEREAKEKKKKEREKAKKAKEKAQKAQISIIPNEDNADGEKADISTDNGASAVFNNSPTPKNKAENPFRLKPEPDQKDEDDNDKVIQLALF